MLGKRNRPVIGKLPDPVNFGDRIGFTDVNTSPKSPLDFKIRSPRGLMNCDIGGVGLGIVAALEKSGRSRGEIPVKFIVGSLNLNLNRSNPIPIGSSKPSAKCRGGLEENYTCVTSRGPNKSITRVYFDGGEVGNNCGHDRDLPWRSFGLFYDSPRTSTEAIPAFPTSDFLSSCYLCRKKLHGKDIYMYRGEKAFCSTECRYRQIVSDERKEKCRSEASITTHDISVSPYSGGRIFSTGITAA